MVLLRSLLIVTILSITLNGVSQENSALSRAFSKSFVLEAESKFSEAAEVLHEEYMSDSYEINIRLGWLLYNAAEYQKSSEYYTLAVSLMPYAIEPKIGLVLPLAKLNKWDEIIEQYKDILSIADKNYFALYNLGLIYYNRGYFQASYDLFKELNNLYPIDYQAMLMHGWSCLKMGKSREAKVLFSKVLLLYPADDSAKEGLEALQ